MMTPIIIIEDEEKILPKGFSYQEIAQNLLISR
jgi:hypothetical protein